MNDMIHQLLHMSTETGGVNLLERGYENRDILENVTRKQLKGKPS